MREGNTFSFSTISQQFFLKDPDGIERNEKIRNSPKATSPRNKTQVATLSTHHMKKLRIVNECSGSALTQIPAHKMHILKKLRQPFIKPQLVSLNDITPKKLVPAMH